MPYVPVTRDGDWMPYPSPASEIQDRGLIAQIRHEGRSFALSRKGGTAPDTHYGIFHDNPETEGILDSFQGGRSMDVAAALSGPMLGVRLADFPKGWPEKGDGIEFEAGQRFTVDSVEKEAEQELGYADLMLIAARVS